MLGQRDLGTATAFVSDLASRLPCSKTRSTAVRKALGSIGVFCWWGSESRAKF